MGTSVVGPTYPYRGGIAYHITPPVHHLREKHQVPFWSFKPQYPRWLCPARTDRDPSRVPLQEECGHLLSPFDPVSRLRRAARVRAGRSHALILPWRVSFSAPAWAPVTWLPGGGPNRVELTTDMVDAGLVVSLDLYCRGWRATVDGQPVEILRANHTQRAVLADLGVHALIFTFRPVSAVLGAVFALATAVIGVIMVVIGTRRIGWRRMHQS